jgi:hypothetical protein
MDRYGSDDKCEAALIASRWPKGFACPVDLTLLRGRVGT